MQVIDIVFIAFGLAMDAFAVSICRGLKVKKVSWKYSVSTAFVFGLFQALMPLAGYLAGKQFESYITGIDHWIAFGLLGIIGINLIKESFDKEDDDISCNEDISFKELLLMGIATSIDALAIGVAFAFLKINIITAVIIIGIITFVLSLSGVYIGNLFGNKLKKGAEILGGVILIAIGIKILLEHLGIL